MDWCIQCDKDGKSVPATTTIEGEPYCAPCAYLLQAPSTEETVTIEAEIVPREVVEPEPIEEEAALIPTFHAVAVNATEMVKAASGIKNWLHSKLRVIDSEIAEIDACYQSALVHKWKSSTFKGQLQRKKQERMYFAKLSAACDAGYTIVPNMPVDVFAIRVKRELPVESAREQHPNWHPSVRVPNETEERLAVGVGRYESPKQTIHTERFDQKNEKGEIIHVTNAWAEEFADFEFPLAVAHPQVMDATAHAMSMKIFDRIGLVTDQPISQGAYVRPTGDPIVLGQITRKVGWTKKTTSFLIAWYLDPRTL